MADSAPVAPEAATIPSSDQIERAAAFTREPFLLEGEDPDVQLAAGTFRRRALDAALAEMEAGADRPSTQWRRAWSLMLGLDRLLCADEPKLVDGTVLSAHQVDALSGTLTALMAEFERNNGAMDGGPAEEPVGNEPPLLASAAIPGEEELPEELQEELSGEEADEEPQDWSDDAGADEEAEQLEEQPEDPNASKRFWFEHATGAGKTVAALGFVEASRTGGVLILTHRRNLVDQFHGELRDRGYANRITPALLRGADPILGAVTVETYQWFVRNAGNISSAYSIVICDEAHTALGDKTSATIRSWSGPIFIGMTATGALIARHVTDLFPTQTSRFDLAQAARRGVISPLRCMRIPPGPGVRTIAKVPLRRGDVDVEFDQELLAELLDQLPFNLAIADLYKTRFEGVPGVVYAAGVRHAGNVAKAFQDVGLKARAVSGETPKRQLAQTLAAYERGDIDVLVNAQLLAEGWNSPRATVCLHLAPTASRRIYQQRVGRVTRRHPGKEAGIVVDFVHPATRHDDPVVTLHQLLDRDVYRGGAIVIGPVRRGRGRRLRVERRVVPVTADPNRRIEVFERELWRIAVEHLDWGEQVQWAALAGARVTPTGWRRARAMLHFDKSDELKRTFLTTAVQRNKNPQLRLRAMQEIAALRDGDAFDLAIDELAGWPREEKREGVKLVLQSLAENKIGRRDQANNWIWRCAEFTREVHEEYAVQRWPETKRLLGLLVNSSGGAHARNARRLVHASRDQDRRLQAAILAAAVPHTAEAGEAINGARARLARKPPSLARELLKNFPKGGAKGKRGRRRRRKGDATEGGVEPVEVMATTATDGADTSADGVAQTDGETTGTDAAKRGDGSSRRSRSRRGGARRRAARRAEPEAAGENNSVEGDVGVSEESPQAETPATDGKPSPRRRASRRAKATDTAGDAPSTDATASPDSSSSPAPAAADGPQGSEQDAPAARPKRARRPRAGTSEAPAEAVAVQSPPASSADEPAAKPKPRRRATKAPAAPADDAPPQSEPAAEPKPRSRRKPASAAKQPTDQEADAGPVATVTAAKRRSPRRTSAKSPAGDSSPQDDRSEDEAA